MNCHSFKNQIDEAAFTDELNRHLEACADCKTFREERECLKRLLENLEHINAPANFEFGVRAKLNSLPATKGNRVWIRRFAFASPALAAVAVSAFVFSNYNSPSVDQPQIAVQSTDPVPIAVNPLPVVTPSPQTLAAANSDLSTETPILTKQVPPALSVSERFANRNVPQRQQRPNAPKAVDDKIKSITIEERPVMSQQLGVDKAQVLLPQEFKDSVTGKVAADKVLSFFGIDKISEDGTVESVNSISEAASKGIVAGDRIETINGRKLTGADLDSSFRQVKIEVLRNGTKRIVTMDLPVPK
ncbi:MAG: PDZ domain-containing protein [Acidobacteriota bacterium]|nr:PDZ domain-containing protein [Acidobacteriota bacterium]